MPDQKIEEIKPANKTQRILLFDYVLFFVLYVFSFYVLQQRGQTLAGYVLLFLVTAIVIAVLANDFIPLLKASNPYFLGQLSMFSIAVTTIFHFIAFIFIFIMLWYFSQQTSSALPEPYASNLKKFDQQMILCFVLGSIVVALLLNSHIRPTHIFKSLGSIFSPKDNAPINGFDIFYSLIAVVSSVSLLGLSSYQIYIANQFQTMAHQMIIA
jgi:hypothetical protein